MPLFKVMQERREVELWHVCSCYVYKEYFELSVDLVLKNELVVCVYVQK